MSVSICPSLIRLFIFPPMSFFAGFTHEVPRDFERTAGLSVFSGSCNLCLRPSCQPGDRHADVNNPRQKPEVACLCVHVNWGLTTKRLGHVLFSDTCHTWTDSSRLCLFSPQPSQPSRGESVPGVCRDLSAPEGVFFKRNKLHSGC